FLKKKKLIKAENYFPKVSLIITAYNEEKRITEKIENTLKLIYPKDKLEVLIVSDGSTDNTNNIVSEYSEKGIELYITSARRGKEFAQKEAVEKVKGEIVVFSDTATILEPDGIVKIISPFSDPTVGSVSSVDVMIGENGETSGEGAYVKYEMWLRNIESKVNSVVGLSGSFFAAKKEVLKDFSGEMQSDFRTMLNTAKLGMRGISNPEAKGFYKNIADENKEFDRKVRTILRGITVYFKHLELLNIFKYGLFSYQYFCHKLLRWLVPLFLIMALLFNISLITYNVFYLSLFILQFVFYGLAIAGNAKENLLNNFVFKIPLYFVRVNLGILFAWIKYFKGERVVMWKPSER
ncbi:MAG: glycosyltransferase family 2 protein, partial [Calditrichia bacterium]|nr:glycosyltransferase family 2 protein [Calditrichia bacterium]